MTAEYLRGVREREKAQEARDQAEIVARTVWNEVFDVSLELLEVERNIQPFIPRLNSPSEGPWLRFGKPSKVWTVERNIDFDGETKK